jgi:hypothetical protein
MSCGCIKYAHQDNIEIGYQNEQQNNVFNCFPIPIECMEINRIQPNIKPEPIPPTNIIDQ